ncbi:hypothetical protein SH668x_002832 [Planctomicrobium sp. SH668]|uniref:hypothetical protein n=1 Tax=Planctomicrobium sp. SH668 TaxID=3448126 RepID=UPI003F5C9F72
MMQILVHEHKSFWTAELERSLAKLDQVSFRWRPYQKELFEELSNAKIVILVVPATDASLDLVRQILTLAPHLHVVCLMESVAGEWEWLARELGASAIFTDTEEKSRVTTAIERLIQLDRSKT